jgi:hypothetical protein
LSNDQFKRLINQKKHNSLDPDNNLMTPDLLKHFML